MRKAFLVTFLMAASVTGGFFTYKYFVASDADSRPMPGELRPEFVLKDIDGQPHSITEWDDKALVVNFWATWCRPCLREIPLLNALQSEYSHRSVQIIGIAVDEVDEVRRFIDEKLEIHYPVLVGGQDAIEAAEGFGIEFIGLPYTAFTDRRGRILGVHVGELTREDAREYFQRLD